jgi:hypothetical protein
LPSLDILQYVSLYTTHCYLAIFYFALGSGRGNTLSDTDAACVAIALALYLEKENNRLWTKEWYK